MMGTVDSKCRFLDVDIRHPGSTSDYLVFATSDLQDKIQSHGFLAPGLVLFGDNAYVNNQHMVVPFKTATGVQDDFNFYHSQLRIRVEMAFGRLVHRWGILRRPLRNNFGIKKISSLVMACCRLHNFCTDCKSGDAPSLLATDKVNIAMNSNVELVHHEDNLLSPDALLHGGEHFNDVGPSFLRQLRRNKNESFNLEPRQKLVNMVINGGFRRPPS